jgi:tetratricopeptide (TPR) repeat protein
MGNIKEILNQAHAFFSSGEYNKALFLYSQVTSLNPTNIEYQMYCIFCDVSYESEEKAQSLFDYFSIAKDENFDEAVKYVQDTLNAYDGDNDKMVNLLKDISHTSVESLNAIEYEDFKSLVDSRGSFREAYQDIMFSTKVAITSKDDLVDFIDNLIENNFNDTAYSYLDGFNEFFSYDKELIDLYEKLGKKDIESNTKQ